MLKKELLAHLGRPRDPPLPARQLEVRTGSARSRTRSRSSERPAAVEDRAIPGHWEGDLIGGLPEQPHRNPGRAPVPLRMLAKVANKDTASVVTRAGRDKSQQLPGNCCRSLTWDRGKELADHKRLTVATDVKVYFCDPQSPWQRGSNENTNRLLRQYFPKGTDLSMHSQAKLNASRAASSTSGQERRCSITHQRRSSQSVLRRSVESATISGHLVAQRTCPLIANNGYLAG